MQRQRFIMAKKYLSHFDQILCEMSEKMLSTQMINNITINFIQCMIPHHQGAIYMCENLLMFTSNTQLKGLAENIIKTQTLGIEHMKDILNTTSGYTNSEKNVNCYVVKYLKITEKMIEKMKDSPRCVNINLNFINEMIPHHKGAIEMCESVLQYCIDPRLKFVADNIIKEQKHGIIELEKIQNNICNSYNF